MASAKTIYPDNFFTFFIRVIRWNFDLDDIDNILRIEAVGISPRTIELKLGNAGYFCEELPD